MKRYAPIFLLLTGLGLTLGYLALPPVVHDRLSDWFRSHAETPVKVVRVKKVPFVRVVEIQVALQPLKQTEIISQVAGVVKEIRNTVGDAVSAGAVVATIQSNELITRLRANEAAVKEAEADLRQKEDQIMSAEKELATARELHGKELIARQEVDHAEAAADAAGAQRDVAQAQLAQRQSMLAETRYVLNLTRLAAPLNGVVTRRWVEPGASVSPSTRVLSIADPNVMRITVLLTTEDAALVHSDMSFRIRVESFSGREFEGKLAGINRSSEPADETAIAEIHLPNPDGLLKAGMKAVLSLPLREAHEVFLLPKESVFELKGKSYVYTVAAGKTRLRAVVKGFEQDGQVAISSGLEEGETVIVAGRDHVGSESRVRASE
jgi:membrane fusion protein, multidrug efflux system